jgi:hypothetical protein
MPSVHRILIADPIHEQVRAFWFRGLDLTVATD